jgi:tape measure domain-containing protein
VSVVANVAVNLDARGVTAQLAAIRQGSIGAADGFKNLQARAQAVKSIVEAQQGSFAKASTVQGVFAAKVKNTEFAIKAQIAALRDVQSKVQFNGALYQKAGQQIKQYEAVLRSANREEEKGIGIKGRLGSALGGLRGALVSIGAGLAVRKAFVDASELESAQARIGLLTKNFSQLTGIQEVAANAAKKFNLSQAESLGTLTDLGNRIGPTGASLQDVANVYEGFNTLLALNKVNTQNAASATLQLNQALGSGRLAGEEFNAISEATPQLLDAVAKVMGRNRSELKQLASDGKISSQVLIEALTRIRTEGAEDLETAFAGAFGATRRFNAALEDFSATIGTELLPALTPLISSATEILKLFGQLPGPVRTLIAAVAGLTAAFVVLAPAISTAIGLLGGLSLATLAAAGPWIALAAGIGVAVAALASYRSEAEKVGGAARGGGAAEVTAASKLLAQKDAQIAGLQGQRQTASGRQRGSIDRNLAVLRRERGQLQSDVKAGTAATPAATAANAMGTPVGATVGGASTGRGGGASRAASDAKRAADQAAQAEQQIQDRLRGLTREIELNAQISTIKELQFQAEMDGNKELQARLQGEERIIQIMQSTAQSLDGITDQRLQQKILAKAEGEIASARQETALEMQRIEAERTKSFNEIIAGLDLELALKTATTEQAREQLRLEAEIAKLRGQGFTPEQIGTITAKKTELAAPKTDQQNITEKIGTLKDEIADLTSISNIAITSAEGIGNAFAQSFQGLISGTMTAKEALGSFFKSVADMFLEMAAQIIAKQITMIILQTILKALGAVGGIQSAGSSAGSAAFGGSGPTFNPGAFSMPQLAGRAVGGPVTSQQPYMVGERGPELFVPGTGGSVVNNGDLRSAMNGGSGGGSGYPVLNMSFQSTSINGVEYVSREQLESAMAETRRNATRDGAKRGMTMTLDRIQNSSSTRRKVGI